MIGKSSYWRSIYAVRIFREGGFRKVVLTGKDAAIPMSSVLQSQGVEPSVVHTGSEAESTREKAILTSRLLDGESGRKVLLTSDYHMFRAERAFRKAEFQVIPRPIPDICKRASSWRNRWPAFLELLEETIKILYYYFRD